MENISHNNFDPSDIVNSKDWKDDNWKAFAKTRLTDMRSKRSPYDESWNRYEKQVKADSFYDNNWELQVNIPLEKQLIETQMWRTEGRVIFDILPDWQTDIEQLQPTKYAMQFFMDWNEKDNFWIENKHFRDIRATYGSWIRYTWIRSYKDLRFEQKEGTEIEAGTDLLAESNFNEAEHESWFFFPKSLHVKDFYIDDWAYWQPNVQYADDAIMKEEITATELELRFRGNKNINQDELDRVKYWTDINKKNESSTSVKQQKIVLYHYYHRLTKKYIILANEEQMLYNWKYFYDDWKLPFENVQFFSNVNRFRGEWFPERVWYIKAYQSEIYQDILSGAQMNSSINLITWNDDQIWQDWTFWGRGVNILRNTWGADWVQQLNTTINLWYYTTVLQILEQQVTKDSWINPQEVFDAWSEVLWIVEIQEARKAIRNRSVDENYNLWLDAALTMMLARIKQFAPKLLATTIEDDWWAVKTIFPSITIKDYKVEKKKGKQVFVKDLGKYWYFELEPDIVQWVWVKTVTSSSNSVLPTLERKKVSDYINLMLTMSQAAALDQSWKSMQELVKFMRFDEVLDWARDAYQIDINWLKANTDKDDIAEENIKMMEELQKILTINQPANVWQNPTQNPWAIPSVPWSEDNTWEWNIQKQASLWTEWEAII